MIEKNGVFGDFIYKLQAFGLKVLEKLFLLMGVRLSSFVMGLMFSIFGPFTPPTITAMKNIKIAMPNLNFFQRLKIVVGMWNNLGRSLAEFVSFNSKKFKDLSEFVFMDAKTIENLEKIRASPKGEIIFTAHFGNWELFPRVFATYNLPVSAVYRKMNNKYADKIVLNYREKTNIEMIPKGFSGVVKLARSLRKGRKIFMLVDQRLKNGIVVPFFGVPTKTFDSVATFMLKYNYKVYAAVCFRRTFSSYFDIKIEEFEAVNTGNLKEDIKETTAKINKTIESWIKTKPEQWFWVHNRWKE